MVSTIGPLVQVAKLKWAESASVFVVASVLSGALFGALLGLLGSSVSFMLPALSTAQPVLGMAALVFALVEMRALPLKVPFCARSVPQSWWRRYGEIYGAIAYGAVLGIGITTVIPFISFYFITLVAVLAGPMSGGFIIGMYGFGRALPVLVGSAALARGLGVAEVAGWAGDRRREAHALCAAALILVGLVLLISGPLVIGQAA